MSTLIALFIIFFIVRAVYNSAKKKSAETVVKNRGKEEAAQLKREQTVRFVQYCEAAGCKSIFYCRRNLPRSLNIPNAQEFGGNCLLYHERGIMVDWVPAEMDWGQQQVYARKTGNVPPVRKVSAFSALPANLSVDLDDIIKAGYPHRRLVRLQTNSWDGIDDDGWILEWQ